MFSTVTILPYSFQKISMFVHDHVLHNHSTQLDTMALSNVDEISIWETVFFMNRQRKKSLLGARSFLVHDDQYIGQKSHLDHMSGKRSKLMFAMCCVALYCINHWVLLTDQLQVEA
jgi:hypothetical protein